MKLRVRCGSKCGGSQPRTRRIPPRLAGPNSPARSDAGLKRGSPAPPAMPLLSRSRRLRSGPVRGVLFRLCIGACRSALIPHPVDKAPAQRLYGFHPLHIPPNPRRSGALLLPAALCFSAANTDPTPGSNDKQPPVPRRAGLRALDDRPEFPQERSEFPELAIRGFTRFSSSVCLIPSPPTTARLQTISEGTAIVKAHGRVIGDSATTSGRSSPCPRPRWRRSNTRRGCHAFARAYCTGRTPSRSTSFTPRCAVRRETAMAIQVSAEIATVYRLLDGSLHHARRGRRLMAQGCSTEELHCYCLTCAESVWLPLCVLVRPAGADSTIGPPWG